MKVLITLTVFFLVFISVSDAKAIYDPASVPNNRFGIHIADTNDIPDAASLVNTNGDWGYVTFVITNEERDRNRWQRVFDELRRLHLIPIVRVATRFDGTNWEKPQLGEIDGWTSFLNELNWVIENRYIVLGNEPNHAKEWGGEVNPEEYAHWLKEFSTKLESTSSDFFILPAGLDASAPNSKRFEWTMDESLFLNRMIKAEPDVFNSIDGWTTHSYPNPGFSGSEKAVGRGTLKTYEWELSQLRNLGVSKSLPVFITETGWSHERLDTTTFGEKFNFAYDVVWDDKRVIAVTPFILSYKDYPFDVFSWKKSDNGFYDYYYDVQRLTKIKGEPIQKTSGEILGIFVPPIVLRGFDFSGYILVKNSGQSIWDKEYTQVEMIDGNGEIIATSFDQIEPEKTKIIAFKLHPGAIEGSQSVKIKMSYKGQQISDVKEVNFFIPYPGELSNEISNTGIINKIKRYLERLSVDFIEILSAFPQKLEL